MNKLYILVLAVGVLAIGAWYMGLWPENSTTPDEVYNPEINPADFTTVINNTYFSLPVGRTFVYEGEAADGVERIEITISGETKAVLGVETLVYRDKVWLDRILIEDTRDYLAQNSVTGDVWYFGEDVDNYEDGELKDHDGAWLAGIDGAKPGIWMKANPQVADQYREEYYVGEAEDMAEIVSITESVEVPQGSYTNCLETKNWTPLEPGLVEFKYYCSEVAGLVLETNPTDGERIELIEVGGN